MNAAIRLASISIALAGSLATTANAQSFTPARAPKLLMLDLPVEAPPPAEECKSTEKPSFPELRPLLESAKDDANLIRRLVRLAIRRDGRSAETLREFSERSDTRRGS